DSYPVEIEGNYGGFRLDAGNREQSRVGQAGFTITKNLHIRGDASEALFQSITHRRYALYVCPRRCGGCRAKSGDGGNVLGACPLAAFLSAAFHQRLGDVNVTTANERACALRTTQLVRRDADEV